LEVGSWKLEAGNWKLEVRSWKLETGRWKLEGGSWKLEVRSWKLESGRWNVECGISLVLSVSFICLASISLKGGKNSYSRQKIDGYTVLHAYYSGFCPGHKGSCPLIILNFLMLD
jgi:hypothetical protein